MKTWKKLIYSAILIVLPLTASAMQFWKKISSEGAG